MSQSPVITDYGARDARITSQTYSPVRRIETLPPELFVHYWRDVHAPLCSRLPGLGFYVQHHFARLAPANLWPLAEGVKPMDLVLDGAVELGFADMAGQEAFIAASPILFGDELNLFGHDLAYYLPQGSKTYIDRQPDGVPNGPDKLHRLHVHFNGGPGEDFKAWARDLASHLASSEAVHKLRLHLPEPYDNDAPSPPSPGVDHHASVERQSLAVMEIGFETALSARTYFDTEHFQSTLAGQARHVRHLGVFLVTGVFTFVRDGKPTLAGLRGSRQAEIIERIGATGQAGPEINRLFVQG
jgi:hypothetical protein